MQTLVLAASAWAIFALLFFLLFSVPLPGQERPEWYGITTYILENVAFLGASLLCLRNWRSPQIVSGRSVWLLIGLGMLSYFVGNLVLGYWELGLGKEPDVTPGDFFFLLTYVLLGWGMLLAVLSRQLTLTPPQWVIVLGILVGSVALAYFLVLKPSAALGSVPPLEQPAFASPPPASSSSPPVAAPPVAAPPVAPAPVEAAPADAVPAEEPDNSPAWAIAIEEFLAPFASVVLLFYVVGDISLVVMATTLLLAFWGGRFSLSWRFIAAAALCFYIADLWFLYAVYNIEDYQTGALPEVFFIFSACLFAIGAALEYDLSTRSRRTSRRRG
ncbi:MAG: hypothetical protein SFY66_28130 [Oculatellaceae cyanobacterium bins.114]|nr:hypothetical protein [Oculatellaceae cyanobacterium bins.114]